jgi:hypothetical protein
MGLGIRDQLGNRLDRQLGVDGQDQRRPVDDPADHREVIHRMVGQWHVVDILRIAERIGMQRVAVRRGARDIGRADCAGTAGAVFDDNRLTDLVL